MLKFILRPFFTLALIFAGYLAIAQCPANLDFESGTFNGWICYTGNVVAVGGTNQINLNPSGPQFSRHTMLSSVPGDGLDEYGEFPKNCPNGSGHSIKLGNNAGGAQAEGVSYQFTIPANAHQFSLIYYYAVVFQDPGHPANQQPRLEIEITNVSDGSSIGCSSFSFIASSSLPGFFLSRNPGGSTPVWCKDWSANSINLDGNAGKTIKLFFKTADCTFSAHFGYAYVDVNTECSSSFVGATFCPDDTAINVRAPYGYQSYKWFNSNFSQVLGTQQVLTLNPPPASGSTVAVELTPYNGYGCKDTLTAELLDTLTIRANAGPDKLSCNNAPVQIGSPPLEGLVYSWSPSTGLSNANVANPTASPSVTTKYLLTVRHDGGGCISVDSVIVNAAVLDNTIEVIGGNSYCQGAAQTILKVQPADSIQWFRNAVAIPGANQTQYTVTQSGDYYAIVFSSSGCTATTATKQIFIFPKPTAGFKVNSTSQCFTGHQFIFTDTSTSVSGTLQYEWNFGDGNTSNAPSPTHSYLQAGTYPVKLLVTSTNGCKDSSLVNVTVNPSAVAAFTTNNTTQCFKANQFVFTNTSTITSGTLQYRWDLGDGTIVTTRDVTYAYTLPGSYTVKLVIIAPGGCNDSTTTTVTINPTPKAGFTINNTTQCARGNQFSFTDTSSVSSGTLQYDWNFGDGSTSNSPNPSHTFTQPGTYTVKLVVTASSSCKDSASAVVTVTPSAIAGFTVNKASQCSKGNQFIFTNTSSISSGSLQYTWALGDGTVVTAKDVTYSYTQPGTYTVKLFVTANGGCNDSSSFTVTVYPSPVAGFTVNTANQCFTGHQYVFSNSSSVSAGTLQYTWRMGDGTTLNTKDITYNYAGSGIYPVKMLVTGDGGCADSSTLTIEVYPNPIADFTVRAVCTNLTVPLVNKTFNNTTSTLNFLWDFGNGQTSTLRDPSFVYTDPGNYVITLSVTSVQCPVPPSSKQLPIRVDSAKVGISYPVQNAVMNFPMTLQARTFGNSILWTPSASLDNPLSTKPIFKGLTEQLYLIEIKTASGCVTVDTQLVKTYKKVEIYVPTGFTPNGDGKNDFLRPILMGFKSVSYFRVFNRWGQKVFEMSSDMPGWNGKVKGVPQDTQAYIWMIEATDVDGIVHQAQGSTVLIR